MQILLYEWITGGGLVEEPSPLPASLLAEGEAMLTALAADFASLPQSQVTVLRDIRLDAFPGTECEVVEVHSREHQYQELLRLATGADLTVVIAPEFDGILEKTTKSLRKVARRLLGSSDAFIAIASNKQTTAEHLAAAGVPVPRAIRIEADTEKLPADFPYPGVLKPLDGAGSQHTYLVHNYRDEPPAHPWPRRLEVFHPGLAASVAFLCGPNHRIPLAACRQHLTQDGRFGYLGGSLLWETELAARATSLAQRALAVLPPAVGYVGVDLVLGNASDGSEDVIIEVNPRLTTSYVGLRAMTDDNLALAMLEIAAGREFLPRFRRDPLEFSAKGAVRRPFG